MYDYYIIDNNKLINIWNNWNSIITSSKCIHIRQHTSIVIQLSHTHSGYYCIVWVHIWMNVKNTMIRDRNANVTRLGIYWITEYK